MQKNQKIDYDTLVENALRSVVREALESTVRHGLPGNHHFYISFLTQYPGIDMANYLIEQYPEEMTVVLQYEFWDLEVEKDKFFVTLVFDEHHERLTIPFASIVSFVDPSVKFGLQFTPPTLPPNTPKHKKTKTIENTDTTNVVTLDNFRKK